jgi:hypothetical protein
MIYIKNSDRLQSNAREFKCIRHMPKQNILNSRSILILITFCNRRQSRTVYHQDEEYFCYWCDPCNCRCGLWSSLFVQDEVQEDGGCRIISAVLFLFPGPAPRESSLFLLSSCGRSCDNIFDGMDTHKFT